MSAAVAEHPSPHRRHGSGPAFLGPAQHNRGTGSSVPLRINFNSSRTPRAPPSRRRSADYWTARHAPIELGMPLQWRSVSSARTSRPPPRAAEEVFDLGLQRIKVREDKHTASASNEKQSLPPTIAEEHSLELSGPPTSTELMAWPSPSPKPTPDTSSPETPMWKAQHAANNVSPLESKSRRIDSPLQDAFEPLPLQKLATKPSKPTGKRRRVPSAWVAADAAPKSSLDAARVYCRHDDDEAMSPPSQAAAASPTSIAAADPPPLPNNEFQIPRKPPPIPKASAAPKPAPLKLFPTTSSYSSGMGAMQSPSSASNVSPPNSFRSGSTLAGVVRLGSDAEPVTPTTLSSFATPATKLVHEASPTHASLAHTTTSGWYDDDDEGNERHGLMGSRAGRNSFAGLKNMWKGCFGCS